MLSKTARRYLGTAVIAVELGCFIGAYRVWHKMNTSQGSKHLSLPFYHLLLKKPKILPTFFKNHQSYFNLDYRRSMHENYPSVLESKYTQHTDLTPSTAIILCKYMYLGVFLSAFYYSAERFAGNLDVRKDDYQSWGVTTE